MSGGQKMPNKINSINKLKKVGSFKDFTTPANLAFSDVNLFYGYNGSGKTTLTRVFQCLNYGVNSLSDNDGELLVDFTGCEIDVKCNSVTASITNFANTTIKDKVKVFNADFVEKNLALKNGRANKLKSVSLGGKNITIQKEITALKDKKAELYNDKKELKAKADLDVAKDNFESLKTTIAGDIRATLVMRNAPEYTKAHFAANYAAYKALATKPAPITKSDCDKAGAFYAAEVKPEIDNKYSAAVENVGTILYLQSYTDIIDLLKTPIKREAAKLKEEVIKWIEEGFVLHTDDHNACKFCGQAMSAEVWTARSAQIQELIKKDDKFEKLENQLSTAKQTIVARIKMLESFSCELVEAHFFTKELFAEYQTARTAFDTALSDFLGAVKTLDGKIADKEKSKDTEIPFDDIEVFNGKVVGLNNAISNVVNAITKNNDAVKASGKLKLAKKEIVINFYIQQNEVKLQRAEVDIVAKTTAYGQAQTDDAKFDTDIKAKESALEDQGEIIKQINQYLEQMLGVGLAFKVVPGSSEYLLERKIDDAVYPAKNLSEGEKNLIAFLYFLVSLESSSAENKKDEIIVIDDPVSSLDSNNLFALQNLVVKTLKAYGQQFFLTHNFYFFAKIRESLMADIKAAGGKPNEKMEIFEIKNNKVTGSTIKKAGKYVRSHISEYMSIMEALHEKLKNADDEKDVATGNLIRRALEVFLCFKDTDKDHTLFYKLQNMARDDVKYQSLLNMGNAFSHTEVGENADFSYAAGKEEIGVLFNFMNKNDPDHFKGFGIRLEEPEASLVDIPVVAEG